MSGIITPKILHQKTVNCSIAKNFKLIGMKQPELGKKIAELRKEKGLTQEELVHLCNINVRTIQRIESGEVTPRSYTLKIILKALDYDLNDIKENIIPIQINPNNIKLIILSFWIGILYIIVDTFNTFLNFSYELEIESITKSPLFSILFVYTQLSSAICALFFYLGFYISGKVYNIPLLKASAIILAFVSISNYFFAAFLIDANPFIRTVFGVVSLISYGAIGIPFGIGLLKLDQFIGQYANITGVLTIILYAAMLTVILVFLAIFLLLPVLILQLILLYKIKTKHTP